MRALPPPAKVARKASLQGRDVSVKSREDPGAFVDLVNLAAEFSVISPVHGGCPNWDATDELNQHVRRLDAVTPVRGSSLRGQLRFWWRATHGCALGSLAEMRKEEDRLWGNASSPGLVQLRIDGSPFSRADVPVFAARQSQAGKWNPTTLDGMQEIAYGAFALQPRGGNFREPPRGVLSRVDGVGRLVLSVPKAHLAEVKDALVAWLLFGGIGGRTRRGFGAVHGKLLLPAAEPLPDASQFLARFPATRTLDLVPSLRGAQLALRTGGDSGQKALATALGRMKQFRQGLGMGRNPPSEKARQEKKPAGRSRWPEPEAIRKITGRASPEHRTPLVGVDKFPRARFGMPIIFHFQDERAGEPGDTELRPSDHNRMGSPVIVRPLCQKGQFQALCLVLSVPKSGDQPLVLAGKFPGSPRVAEVSLSPSEAARILPLGDQADPLAAFLDFFAR